VPLTKLNRMLDLTGEIAIARGRVRELASADERILDAARDLDRLCFDLQELVMSARMVALAPALRPFQRVVRDVAASRGKRVTLVIEAGDVEVDSTVVEQLRDPITHMLRNSIDHGIEKDGTIRITASHDRSGITIRLSDDGKGLDEERIAQRAKEMGLGAGLDVIFEPGFSTAETVTEVSGRGVGMDVVRRNVELLRGTVSVSSQRGAGTTITIRLPLTVSVIEGFAVAVAGETYVLPIDTVAGAWRCPTPPAPMVRHPQRPRRSTSLRAPASTLQVPSPRGGWLGGAGRGSNEGRAPAKTSSSSSTTTAAPESSSTISSAPTTQIMKPMGGLLRRARALPDLRSSAAAASPSSWRARDRSLRHAQSANP
jgi:two-component sensor histidine kinase